MGDSRWKPLLEGELAERARLAIDEIALALRDPPPASESERVAITQRRIDEGSLGRGRAGYALFFGYKSLCEGDAEARKVCASFVEEAIQAVASTQMSPSLFVGFTGIAWVTDLLNQEVFRSTEDPNEEIDEALLYALDSDRRKDYDLISGWVGIGLYGLRRLPRPSATKLIERVVDRLDESAHLTPEGTTWFTDPQLMPPLAREKYSRGVYNLGVAHGAGGVISLLGSCCAHGVAVTKAKNLLDGAIEWLLAQEIEGDPRCLFPSVVANESGEASRSAWCYGDPGLAAALLVAGRGAGEPAWETEAARIGRAVARRPPELCGVNDATLCHGASSLAHLLNRLFQITGDAEMGEGARRWFERTLAMHDPGAGVGGFRTWRAGGDEDAKWIDQPGFLSGAAGIGLALLGAVSAVSPKWDEVLAMSIPEAG